MSYASTFKEISNELERLKEQKDELDKRVANLEGTLLYFRELMETEQPSSSPQIIKDNVYNRLTHVGRPVHRKDLFEYLQQLGIKVNGQNPVGNMTAHMSQDDRFESVGDGRWGLLEWTHPSKRGEGSGVIYVPSIREPDTSPRSEPDDLPF